MMSEAFNSVICTDCAMAEVNADYTGMGEHREAEVRKAFKTLALEGYRVVVDTDEVHEFSWQRCGVCDLTLGGTRYGAIIYPLGV